MSGVRLTLRAEPVVALDAPGVRPDAFATLTEAEIARLPAWHGKQAVRLGDFFDVRGAESEDVRVEGDVQRVKRLGAEMAGGRLVISGRAGLHTGAGMSGGRLVIEGDADEWTGTSMRGGVLEVRGNAGAQFCGALPGNSRGMSGGVALVHGSVGERAGERLRRGVIAVAGNAGAYAAAHMIGGTLLVNGSLGRGAGIGMKHGTILAGSTLELLPTFRFACQYRPSFLPLLFQSLEAHGFEVAAHLRTGAFRRYGGDFADLGRGEILQWTFAAH